MKILLLGILFFSFNTYAYDAFTCVDKKLFYSEDRLNYTVIDNETNSLECVSKSDNYSDKELETDLRSMQSNLHKIPSRFYLEINGRPANLNDFQIILNRVLYDEI